MAGFLPWLIPAIRMGMHAEDWRAVGQDARLLEVDGDHFSVADTSAPTWPAVIKALEELLDAA